MRETHLFTEIFPINTEALPELTALRSLQDRGCPG